MPFYNGYEGRDNGAAIWSRLPSPTQNPTIKNVYFSIFQNRNQSQNINIAFAKTFTIPETKGRWPRISIPIKPIRILEYGTLRPETSALTLCVPLSQALKILTDDPTPQKASNPNREWSSLTISDWFTSEGRSRTIKPGQNELAIF